MSTNSVTNIPVALGTRIPNAEPYKGDDWPLKDLAAKGTSRGDILGLPVRETGLAVRETGHRPGLPPAAT